MSERMLPHKTPLEQLYHWWQKATSEERLTFLRDPHAGTTKRPKAGKRR
jgi:hypothetical protein